MEPRRKRPATVAIALLLFATALPLAYIIAHAGHDCRSHTVHTHRGCEVCLKSVRAVGKLRLLWGKLAATSGWLITLGVGAVISCWMLLAGFARPDILIVRMNN